MASRSPNVFRRYRWTELGLFIIPFMILVLEMSQLLLAKLDTQSSLSAGKLPTLQGLIPALGIIVALLLVNLVLSFRFRKADQMLLPLVGLLSGIGVIMATRIGPDINDPLLGTRQLYWVLLGLVVFMATMFILRDTYWLESHKYIVAVFGVFLFCTTLINTLRVHNFNTPTHDQLNIGPFAFQPSELFKICIVIFFAAYLAENRDMFTGGGVSIGPFRLSLPPLRYLGPPTLMLLIALLLFLFVRELGLALFIYGIFLCMSYLGSGKLSYVIFLLLVFVVLGYIGYAILPFAYARQRIAVVGIDIVHWTANSENLYQQSGGAFQVVQGLIALSSGGILGAGLGLGHPAGQNFVPVAQSDMIFTALGEELGLAGLFAILGIYLLILYRGFRIAMDTTKPFDRLLAAGLTSIFAIQTLIIAAGNMKFLPLTGIPLPFLSYGGSSILANFIIIGILLRISHNTAKEREGSV